MEWWNPHGIHKESTWNIGGKKSPKWVRSQPKHIPCEMGRFHVEQHGFHMDSTWISCGIGGQGKDLPTMPPTDAMSPAPDTVKKAVNSTTSPPPNTSQHPLNTPQPTPRHRPPMTPTTPPSNATSLVPDGPNDATSPSQTTCRMVGIKG